MRSKPLIGHVFLICSAIIFTETKLMAEVLHTKASENKVEKGRQAFDFLTIVDYCKDTCTKAENKVAEKVKSLQKNYGNDNVKIIEGLKPIILELISLAERSSKNKALVSLYSSAYHLLNASKNLDLPKNKNFEQKIKVGIEALPKKVPNDIEVYKLLSSYHSTTTKDYDAALSAINQCLKIDDKDQDCRAFYDKELSQSNQLRCFQKHISPRLKIHLASSKKDQTFTDKIIFADQGYIYLLPQPILVNKHIAAITELKESNNPFSMSSENLQFSLTEVGEKRLEQIVKKNLGKKLAIVFEGKLIFSAKISSSLSSGFIASFGWDDKIKAKAILADICVKDL